MLIKYEYELLSYFSSKGIKKVNGDIVVSFKRIQEELLEDDKLYIEYLETNEIVDLYEDKLIISIEKWSEFFAANLAEVFQKNDIHILTKIKKQSLNNDTIICIEFHINGATKEFLLKFNDDSDNYNKKDLIFMCTPNVFSKDIYWIELINNVNVLRQFYNYLVNESNFINRVAYREIRIFEGIDDKHVMEVFNYSIKEYFLNRNYKVKNYDQDEYSFIKDIYCKDSISLYGLISDKDTLWIIKDDKKITFISMVDKQLTYSKAVDNSINELEEKVQKKVKEFNDIMLFKENGVLEATLNTIKGVTTILVPLSMIFTILSFININIKLDIIMSYKPILIIIIIILGVIQVYLLKVTIWPAYKLSKFNWKV